MKKRLELLELQGQGGARGRPQQVAAGFSTWIVLLIAVLSFLVGKYLAVSCQWVSTRRTLLSTGVLSLYTFTWPASWMYLLLERCSFALAGTLVTCKR